MKRCIFYTTLVGLTVLLGAACSVSDSDSGPLVSEVILVEHPNGNIGSGLTVSINGPPLEFKARVVFSDGVTRDATASEVVWAKTGDDNHTILDQLVESTEGVVTVRMLSAGEVFLVATVGSVSSSLMRLTVTSPSP